MPILHFGRATDPPIHEAVHINTDAILFVEKCHNMQVGKTAIHVMGLDAEPIRVTESLTEVLVHLPGFVQARRHYLAAEPANGADAVHIAAQNVSYVLPNVPQAPLFWTVHFTDASELCIVEPLPARL